MTNAATHRSSKSPTLRRLSLGAGLAIAAAAAFGGVARADCNEDFGKLMAKRMAEVTALNGIAKANGGKLDPVAACPKLRSLAASEAELVSYMGKNKDWCNLPDDLVEKMTASRAKTASVAVKACGFAAKMKDMQAKQSQQAQQQEQAVKLPTGPL